MAGLLSPGNGQDAEDRQSLISIQSVDPSPDTLTSKPHLLLEWLKTDFYRTYQSASRVDTGASPRGGRP